MAEPILSVVGISKRHKLPKENLFAKSRSLQVLQDVSFSVSRGEVLGIVGAIGFRQIDFGVDHRRRGPV
ncbi:hypothetical protein ACOJBM_41800 [Rhizobium beringeri]